MNSTLNIDKILVEWAWRIDSGTPSIINPEHVIELRKVLESFKYDESFIDQFIYELTEKKEVDPRLKGKHVYNPKTKKQIAATTALAYGADHPAFPAAKALLKKDKQVHGDEDIPRSKEADKKSDQHKKNKGKEEPKGKEDSTPKKKDITLKKVNTTDTETFKKTLYEGDMPKKEFYKVHKDLLQKKIWTVPPGLKSKSPNRYLSDLIERYVNIKPEGRGTSLDAYTKYHGAGTPASNLGEVITVLGTGMEEKDFLTLTNSLLKHEAELKKMGAKSNLSEAWIKTAIVQSTINKAKISKLYPDAKIIATCWDVPQELEALGVTDPKVNKGPTTDMSIKIQTKDGAYHWVQTGLKQNSDANFLNGSARDLVRISEKRGVKIPDNVNSNVYAANQKQHLQKGFAAHYKEIVKKIDSPAFKELKAIIEAKKKTKDYLDVLEKAANNKTPNDSDRKIMMYAIKGLSEDGNKDAEKWYSDHRGLHEKFIKNIWEETAKSEDFRKTLIQYMSNSLPLRLYCSGEESETVNGGDGFSIDQLTLKKVFGTIDWDKITERMTPAKDANGRYYIAYKAGPKENVVPVAKIEVREKGVGYSSNIEMVGKLHKGFATALSKAYKEIYSEK